MHLVRIITPGLRNNVTALRASEISDGPLVTSQRSIAIAQNMIRNSLHKKHFANCKWVPKS